MSGCLGKVKIMFNFPEWGRYPEIKYPHGRLESCIVSKVDCERQERFHSSRCLSVEVLLCAIGI